MEHTQIFRSVLSPRRTARIIPKSQDSTNNAQPSNEPEYDSDEINANSTMNHSRLFIMDVLQLVEPARWYLGKNYYVVTKGSDVGVFDKMSDVRQSISSALSPEWETFKTWQQAVKYWDQAYQHGTISLICLDIWNTAPGTRRLKTKTPTPHVDHEAPTPRTPTPHIDLKAPDIARTSAKASTPAKARAPPKAPTPAKARTLVSARLAPPKQKPTSGTSTTLLSSSTKCFLEVIVISDSDSDSNIEVTSPRKIQKKNDCFEFTDDKNGETTVVQTYDAKTDTHFDVSTKAKVPSQAKASHVTVLPRSKIHAPVTVDVSGSGHESDSNSSNQASL